jgi:hypothetical protein
MSQVKNCPGSNRGLSDGWSPLYAARQVGDGLPGSLGLSGVRFA